MITILSIATGIDNVSPLSRCPRPPNLSLCANFRLEIDQTFSFNGVDPGWLTNCAPGRTGRGAAAKGFVVTTIAWTLTAERRDDLLLEVRRGAVRDAVTRGALRRRAGSGADPPGRRRRWRHADSSSTGGGTGSQCCGVRRQQTRRRADSARHRGGGRRGRAFRRRPLTVSESGARVPRQT